MTQFWEPSVEECQEPIAVVGMGCRWPGKIESPSELWDFLIEKKSGYSPRVPPSRFNIDAHLHPNLERPGSFNVSGGYFLEGDLRDFDPSIFGISPVEAMWLDPQQRKLLEVVYECLESAGVTMEAISGSQTGCFVGSFTNDYQQMSMKEQDFRHSYAATGVDPGLISNRISHVFNLGGPSFTINTACSSSVYALHQACNALHAGDCTASIVGGTNLILTVDQHINTAKLGVLSPTSQCHTFNAHADGYGRGEGVGALYLKRLSDAIRNGDPIRAVIRGSAVNSNGRVSGAGITHPSLDGQANVIREAYRISGGLNPLLTGYFECHGTGTAVGDPLEVEALSRVMSPGRAEPLIIGAVKASIGHCEAASGIAAVMKAVLAVEKGVIPPTYGFANPNPHIKWNEWNVRVNTEPIPWPSYLPIRRASVNSFGYGGTNAHIIIEALDSVAPSYIQSRSRRYPALLSKPIAITRKELCSNCAVDFDEGYRSGREVAGTEASWRHNSIDTQSLSIYGRTTPLLDVQDSSFPPTTRQHFLLPFSAHDSDSLRANIKNLAEASPNYDLMDLAYTLSGGRSLLTKRAFSIAKQSSLKSDLGEDFVIFGDANDIQKPRVAFVFTGQGAQWPTMGSTLMDEFPSFLQTIRLLDSVLERLEDAPLWTLEGALRASGTESRIHEVALSQPLCTAVQIALLRLLESWNIIPVATVGHSSGEIAAAYAAGLLTAAEAIIVAFYRGKAVKENTTTGAMLAVGLGVMGIAKYVSRRAQRVVIACQNSSKSVTLSGNSQDIAEIAAELDAEGIFNRKLKTDGRAYHSPHMKPCAAPYETFVSNAYRSLGIENSPFPPTALMVSSVTAEAVKRIDPGYWSQNLTGSVLFDSAVAKLLELEPNITHIVELGPHNALAGPIRQILQDQSKVATYESTLVRNSNSVENILKLAGKLFLKNHPVDLVRVNAIEHTIGDEIIPQYGELLNDLPRYQWAYKKLLWAENRWSQEQRHQTVPRHDILGRRIFGVSAMEPIWRNILRQKDLPWLKDHQIGPDTIFPGAGHWAMAVEAVMQIHQAADNSQPITGFRLRDISIKTALVIPDNDDGVEVLLSLRKVDMDGGKEWYGFSVKSISNGIWTEHSSGDIAALTQETCGETPVRVAPPLLHKATGKQWYNAFLGVGFIYGPSFQGIDGIMSNPSAMDATATVPIRTESGTMKWESRYALHPSSIDNCLQLALISIYSGMLRNLTSGYVPVKAREITILIPKVEETALPGKAYARTTSKGVRSATCFVQLTAGNKVLLDIDDLRVISYDAVSPQKLDVAIDQPCWQSCWVPEERPTDSELEIDEELHRSQVDTTRDMLVVYRGVPSPSTLVQICELAPAHGYTMRPVCLSTYSEKEYGVPVLMLLDLESSFLLDMGEEGLMQLRRVLNNASSVVWLTNGSLSQGGRPEDAMVLGLKRSLVSEQASLDLKIIDTDVVDDDSLPHIFSQLTKRTEDTEFLIRDGVIHVNRLYPHVAVNSMHEALCEAGTNPTIFTGQRLNGRLSSVSQPTIEFVYQEGRNIPTGCVEVEVRARGVNNEDLRVLAGKVDHTNFSREFSGVVVAVADDVTCLQVGDSVCGICVGEYSTYQMVTEGLCQKIEAYTQEDFENAALMPVAYTTAHHALLSLARLQEDETVVITAETGFAGHVIVALAQSMKAKVYIAVSSYDQIASVQAAFGLSESRIIVAGDNWNIKSDIWRLTGSIGFDVVLTSSSSHLNELWRTIAPAGRLIQLGFSDLAKLDITPFSRGATYSSIDIDVLYSQKKKLLSRIWKNAYLCCSQLLTQSSIKLNVFPMHAITEALRNYSGYVWDRKHIISYRQGESILIRPETNDAIFDENSSYLLVGCLGGLGRSLSSWMLQRGAKSLVFLSRTGDDKPEAARLIDDIRHQGCRATVIRGDVSVKEDVLKARMNAPTRIRGIVHAATVFEDALFETLDLSGFERSFKAKVTGTKNLHETFLDVNLEFFIMTSSISATLGTPGQTNYAAGNSYLDYMARHRQALGLPATSLILPMVLGVGYVSEHPEIEQSLARKGLYGIDEEELLRAFEIAVRGWKGEQPEMIVGLDPSRLAKVLQESSIEDPFWFNDPRLSNIRASIQAINSNISCAQGAAQGRIADRLRQEFGTANQEALLETAAGHIKEKLSRMMLIDLDEISISKPVSYYGVDSSIGTELRNWLFNEFKVDLSIQTMLSPSMPLKGLAEHLCVRNGLVEQR